MTPQRTIERRTLNGFKLARLAMCPHLRHWERKYIAGISHRPRLSPTQQKIFDRLVTQYLEAKAP